MKDIIIIGIGLLLFALVWGVWQHIDLQQSTVSGGGVPCADDAQMCSDGSFVGRVPPQCDFSDCPE